MGPRCPHCKAIYEWTCGEFDEDVMSPKIYFCPDCRHMWTMTAEEVTAIQDEFRPQLESSQEPPRWDQGLHDE